MSVRITYFVHGTTTDNENDLATGWLPGELSPTGKEQTIQLGKLINNLKFDVVFCSDSRRAVESAYIAFRTSYKIIEDKRLRECNYGQLNGERASLFKSRLEDYIDILFPGGESYKEVEQRVASFVDFLKATYDGKHVAIVAHQAPQLALDVLLKGKSWPQAIKEDWRNRKAYQPGWAYTIK